MAFLPAIIEAMDTFPEVYKALNAAQAEAVDTIDGPLLVIAGPGTGKTQLLSARVANILEQTDTPARNILCLTFTENGAENMRRRLASFIGQPAYDVTISTYHAFGGNLIDRYPEYFKETRLQSVADELVQRQIVNDIVEGLHYSNPLKQTRYHPNDLISTISEMKRALLDAADLRLIAAENLLFIQQASRDAATILTGFTRIPNLEKALPLFERILAVIQAYTPERSIHPDFISLADTAVRTLHMAMDEAVEKKKTTPLTKWKNDWLVKDGDNRFMLAGKPESERMQALAGVMEQYSAALETQGLYDYDDMILRAVRALEENDEFRWTLQEQYLYILLDEFQDTNKSQLRLVQLLTNNPVSEGRPNVMAVGDDDQAIYAFQGALYSNMLDFKEMYRDVRIINLTQNYRSTPDILEAARNVAGQIEERLDIGHPGMSKDLTAAGKGLPQTDLTRYEFLSDIAQADWIARKAKTLIDKGVSPREIAVLAPRHKHLEQLVPYFNNYGIHVSYEKRDDILQTEVVRELITMSRLVLALHDGDELTADSLWPEVLSYEFWRLPVSEIWKQSWQVADARRLHRDTPDRTVTWTRALLDAGEDFRVPALLFMTLANKVAGESCETMLDYLIGTAEIDTNEFHAPRISSPLRDFYTSDAMRDINPNVFYDTLTHLTELRARLRAHQAMNEGVLYLRDLIAFVDLYKDAGERMVGTSPYNQRADAVQIMTIFKAKGLEFEHVFVPYLQEEVWGSSRGQSNRLTLPANLAPARHAGATDDERLRILFVAFTRAKYGLHLTSVAQSYNGKESKRLRYLDERETADGSVRDYVLPEHARLVIRTDDAPPSQELLETDWRKRHRDKEQYAELKSLLAPRLAAYRVSPTHLSTFLDLEYGGPERFFFSTILQFPEAPSTDGEFGNAIHETLQWVQNSVNETGSVPSTNEAVTYFASRMRRKKLTEQRIALEIERGETALAAYLAERSGQYKAGDKAEQSFSNENAFLGDVHLGGKVDRLEIDRKNKEITVVDYKTGKSFSKWLSDAKLYMYRRQLHSYKILIEHSSTFAGYHVPKGRLEFVEPGDNNRIHVLELPFQDDEVEHTQQLMAALWKHVHNLEFPDVSAYAASLKGIKQFEQDLIDGNI